jgi:hypothetical protein
MYEAFLIHLSPKTLHILAAMIRADAKENADEEAVAELLNLACEIEARLQHIAVGLDKPADDNWLA